MKKRALVAGAAGMIASCLCDRLIAENYTVIGVDNFLSGSPQHLSHLKNHSQFTLIEQDICTPLNLSDPIDEIYHLACPASPEDFKLYPVEILFVNATGTYHLLELARKYQAKLLFTSTSEVYGDPAIHPQVETYWGNVNPVGERSCYDEGKRFAESLIMTYHRLYALPMTIARVFNTYGPRMRANDGRVVPNFVRQALKQEPLIIHGDGHQTRSFCYVNDLVDGLYRLMRSDLTIGNIYNIGNPDEYTIEEFAKMVCEVAGIEPLIQSIPSPRMDDPTRRKPDISKINSTVGWNPSTPLREGLKKTLDYFKEKSGN